MNLTRKHECRSLSDHVTKQEKIKWVNFKVTYNLTCILNKFWRNIYVISCVDQYVILYEKFVICLQEILHVLIACFQEIKWLYIILCFKFMMITSIIMITDMSVYVIYSHDYHKYHDK